MAQNGLGEFHFASNISANHKKMWLFIGVVSAISPFNCRLCTRSHFMLSRLFHSFTFSLLLSSSRSLSGSSNLALSTYRLALCWAFKNERAAICNVGDDFDNRRASDVNCTSTTPFMHFAPI